MKYALIESRPDIGEGIERAAQIVATAGECFPVAPTLTWEEVSDSVQPGAFRKDGTWGTFGEVVSPPSEDERRARVKAEAMRRILAICPEWRQRNLTAQAVLLAKKVADGGTLTTREQADWDAGKATWDQIAAIRAASDAIEALDPIPHDFAQDEPESNGGVSYWP
jgi:hypothetical protein